MAVRIKFDGTHNIIPPTFVLANRSGKKLGTIPAYDIEYTNNFNSYDELSFKVCKYDNGKEYHLWNKLQDFKLVWCKEYDLWFEIYVELDENNNIVKNIEAKSLAECELSQINLYKVEINTESDISRDDYIPTILFNSENQNASLLHRIMEKVPHYRIIHVDESIKDIQRTFSFDNISVYDAFQEIAQEINCIFIFNNGTDYYGKITREINVYDLESHCLECSYREEFSHKCPKCGSENILTGYGDDTNIFVSADNLAENILYSTDINSVKNCFKLEAGDDLMTATIINCNPNGSGYIWSISNELKSDMPDDLVKKLEEYDELYSYYEQEHTVQIDKSILNTYNELVDKYYVFNENLRKIPGEIVGYSSLMNSYYDTIDMYLYLNDNMMPGISHQETNANLEAEKLSRSSLSPIAVTDLKKASVSTINLAVLAVAKTIISSRYQVKIKNSIYNNNIWTGNFIVTNYSDEEDTAVSMQIDIVINDDYKIYVEQKLKKILNSSSDDVVNISNLFKLSLDAFTTEIKKYCLSQLASFHSICESCINILIEQGIADDKNWKNKNLNLYATLYEPYYQKLLAIKDEIKIRENEISIVTGTYNSDGNIKESGMQTIIDNEKIFIQNALDFEKYLGDLWFDFIAYRREDIYLNDNYISDGLDNKTLYNNALEFIKTAKKEIYKSSNLQHTISASLKNFLAMKEFEPITKYFEVGNWIRVRVDNNIYKLRLISYTTDYENIDNISIVFSDVKNAQNGLSDSDSVLQQAASIITSYPSVKRQAGKGENTSFYLNNWINKGLDITNIKLISDVDNQEQSWDSHGMLFRKYEPITETYDDTQLKIINSTIAITDDNWKTSKTALGRFLMYDPEDHQLKESYGIIAQTLVGNLILSENVGIYNKNNNISLSENGFLITTNGDDSEVSPAFTIQRQYTDSNGDIVLEKQLYIDEEGNMVFHPKKFILEGSNLDNVIDNKVQESIKDYTEEVAKDIEDIKNQIDGNVMQWFYDYDPSDSNIPEVEWETEESKKEHLGDLFYNTTTGATYRYSFIDDKYVWDRLSNSEISKVLEIASQAKDTADGKRRVFVVQPIPPYDIGDIWLQGENGDLLRCQTSKGKDDSFSDDDWVIGTKYTDDTLANIALEEAKKSKSFNIILQNDYQSIPTDSDGNYDTFPDVSTTVSVFYGAVNVTDLCTYDITKSSGVTGIWNNETKTYKVTALLEDSGWVNITASYSDLFTTSKRFNISKNKQGSQGLPGEKGENGNQLYTWLKYADTPTSGMSDDPNGKVYMGIAYNKDTSIESNNYEDYSWSLITGEGIPGEDGSSLYTWVRYATSEQGDNMSDSPDGMSYIGLAYNKETEIESDNPDDYVWALIKGEPGRTYILQPNVFLLKQGADKLYTPETISFQAFYRDGDNATRVNYSGRFKIEESDDGINFTQKYLSDENEQSYIYTPTSNNLKMIRCTLYEADGADVILDIQSVTIVKDIDNLTQQDIFNTLTNGGQTQGIYLEDNKVYINGEYIKSESIVGESIQAGAITGLHISAGAVTAEKIDVKDLSALGATIGGMFILNDKIYGEITDSNGNTWGSGIAPYKQNQYSLWVGETNLAKGTATTDAPFKVTQNGTVWADRLYAGNSVDFYEETATWKGKSINIFRDDCTLNIRQNHHQYGDLEVSLHPWNGETRLVFNWCSQNHGTVYFYGGYNSNTYVGLYHKERNNGAGGAIFRYETDGNFHVISKMVAGQIECSSLVQTSSPKYKKNIQPFNNSLEIIKQCRVYKYNLIDKVLDNGDVIFAPKKQQIGLIINNAECPFEFLSDSQDSVNIYAMISTCISAIQEQQIQIETLQNIINKGNNVEG